MRDMIGLGNLGVRNTKNLIREMSAENAKHIVDDANVLINNQFFMGNFLYSRGGSKYSSTYGITSTIYDVVNDTIIADEKLVSCPYSELSTKIKEFNPHTPWDKVEIDNISLSDGFPYGFTVDNEFHFYIRCSSTLNTTPDPDYELQMEDLTYDIYVEIILDSSGNLVNKIFYDPLSLAYIDGFDEAYSDKYLAYNPNDGYLYTYQIDNNDNINFYRSPNMFCTELDFVASIPKSSIDTTNDYLGHLHFFDGSPYLVNEYATSTEMIVYKLDAVTFEFIDSENIQMKSKYFDSSFFPSVGIVTATGYGDGDSSRKLDIANYDWLDNNTDRELLFYVNTESKFKFSGTNIDNSKTLSEMYPDSYTIPNFTITIHPYQMPDCISPWFSDSDNNITLTMEYNRADDTFVIDAVSIGLVGSIGTFTVDLPSSIPGMHNQNVVLPEFDSLVYDEIDIGVLFGTTPATNIDSAEKLFNIRYYPFQEYILQQDIDLLGFEVPAYHSELEIWNDADNVNRNFLPIADYYDKSSWNGDSSVCFRFDGNNHKISNINMPFSSWSDIALFEELKSEFGINSYVKNVKLTNAHIIGYSGAGICGEGSGITIENCFVDGIIEGDKETGGIIGYSYDSLLINKCGVEGVIKGTGDGWNFGGLIGYNEGLITKSYSLADVDANGDVGGFAGGNSGIIKNCFARGNVTGNNYGAGFVSYQNGTIENCYSAGTVNVTSNGAGFCYNDATQINCYYNTETSGFSTDDNRATPKTTEKMTYPLDESLVPKLITYSESSTVEFQEGTLSDTTAVDNALELAQVSAENNTCSFECTDSPSDDWISAVKITDQNNNVLLDSQTPEYSPTGYRDNSNQIIECSAGDTLTIEVTVEGGYDQYLYWGHNISGTLTKIADLGELSTPATHSYTWTVPDNQGLYIVSWWESYNTADSPCGNYSYAERQDFTLAIDTSVGYKEYGERIAPKIDFKKFEEIKEVNSSEIYWTEELNGKLLTIKTSVDGGSTWQTCTNGGAIPNLTSGVTGVLVKAILESNDSAVTPRLLNLIVNIDGMFIELPAYVGWDFEETWGIHEDENEGYPNFNLLEELLIYFSSRSNYEITKLLQNYAMFLDLNIISTHPQIEYTSNLPIVRTNSSRREGDKLYMSGTLVSPGPFAEEMINRDISGFCQYASGMFELGDFALNKTSPITLPDISHIVYEADLAADVAPEDTEIELVNMPSEYEIDSEAELYQYKYVMLYDGNRQEQIGYSATEGNFLKQVDRGLFDSKALNFLAGDTAYRIDVEGSYTWEDSMGPTTLHTDYKYRAGVEIDSYLRSTGESYTFIVYGGERTYTAPDIDENFSDINRGELFLDARDLEFEDQLLDRAKLEFEEMEFESWNTDEFKNWVWDESSNIDKLYFETMTLAELIKIASGITDYNEQDLVNNYSRDQIEQIISDKLHYNTTADDIDSWAFDVSKLVARLLTGEPSGAYDDWTEGEVKDFLKTMLTNEFSFGDFESKFPFKKWESMKKAKLNISINNNASIEVEYNQYGPYNYMIDFRLGDLVVVEYPDVFRAITRIIEVKEEHTQEGKKYTLTLGKEFETLIGKLKSDKDSISGRL